MAQIHGNFKFIQYLKLQIEKKCALVMKTDRDLIEKVNWAKREKKRWKIMCIEATALVFPHIEHKMVEMSTILNYLFNQSVLG